MHSIPQLALGSLADLAGQIGHFGPMTQIAYRDEHISFADHANMAASLAATLAAELDVRKGTRIGVAMRNYPEFSIAFWAAQMLGAVFVPLNAWWRADELTGALDLVRPSVIIADEERAKSLGGWPNANGAALIAVRHEASTGMDFDALIAAGVGQPGPSVDMHHDDPATLLFTSGTTGRPRAIVHSHGNHLANLNRTLALRQASRGQGRNVQLATMPLFHIAQLSSLYINAASGGALVLMRKWDAERAIDLIEQHGVTHLTGVPSQIESLLDAAGDDYRPSSLVSVSLGATAIPAALLSRIQASFGGGVSASNGYGMTETTSTVAAISGIDLQAHMGSVGKPHPTVDLRIIAGDGTAVANGIVGEIAVKGPNVTFLEWREGAIHPFRTKSQFFRTGDLGHLDGDGYLHLAGRLKDVIIRSGENIHAAEIEALLENHEGIAAAAVIGLPHAIWGEEVTAILVADAAARLDLVELKRGLAEKLAYFKVPTRYHIVRQPLERTATGKVHKAGLRERFALMPPGSGD